MKNQIIEIGSRNKTIKLVPEDYKQINTSFQGVNDTICGDCTKIILPNNSVDLLILDPPYNLSKSFNGKKFYKLPISEYSKWLEDIFLHFLPFLKDTSSVYVCGDWLTSVSIFEVFSKHLVPQNRITWEREKGRGAKKNWKNCSEDIWFFTMSDNFTFNVDNVKIRRKVLAPYKNKDGSPKDWDSNSGHRDTYPSNIWTDISVPFWSMPENTPHPTQKPEKLIAKLILASSKQGDLVFDPFLGSGTTSVVSKKLGRNYIGIEQNMEYCLFAEKRLKTAEENKKIQGYDGIFHDRNFK